MKPLPLHEGASPCVGSGFCCKKGPCPFGSRTSEMNPACIHLVLIQQEPGLYPRYTCGIYDEIIGRPGWEFAPAFGAGCCSTLFNEDRSAIIAQLRNTKDLVKHHQINPEK